MLEYLKHNLAKVGRQFDCFSIRKEPYGELINEILLAAFIKALEIINYFITSNIH
jgi:hypothetical protein